MSVKKTIVVGLVGGIAAGKSHVAHLLREMGAVLIDADAIGHSVLNRPLVARSVAQEFGSDILGMDGNIHRPTLGRIVFSDQPEAIEKRKRLEAILHPIIHAEAVQQLRALQEQDAPPPIVVIDAPLLLEAGWAPMCDLILYVETPPGVRLDRAMERGWSRPHFEQRESSQLSLDDKRKQSTHLVDGVDGDQAKRQLADIIRQAGS